TDRYFRQARNELMLLREVEKRDLPKKDRERFHERVRDSQDIAQSTAWALVYYLSLVGNARYLDQYARQLEDLPRDLELSDATLQACFAKAFNMQDARDPLRPDPAKVATLANDWFDQMENISLEHLELESFRSESRSAPLPK